MSRDSGCFGDRTSLPTRTRKELALTAIEYLVLGVEQFMRELPDDEFDALVARCRPPAPGPVKRGRRSPMTGPAATQEGVSSIG